MAEFQVTFFTTLCLFCQFQKIKSPVHFHLIKMQHVGIVKHLCPPHRANWVSLHRMYWMLFGAESLFFWGVTSYTSEKPWSPSGFSTMFFRSWFLFALKTKNILRFSMLPTFICVCPLYGPLRCF